MSDLQITITLPEELVERARSVGVQLDVQGEQIIALLDAQIRKREAAQNFRRIGEQLQALPSELKPTPEEIEAEIRAYWAEKAAPDSDEY